MLGSQPQSESVDWLRFLPVFFLFVYFFLRSLRESKEKAKPHKQPAQEMSHEVKVRKLLKSLEEEKKTPVPKKKQHSTFDASIEKVHMKTKVEHKLLSDERIKKPKASKGYRILIGNLRDQIIAKELLAPPKALQHDDYLF